MKTIFLNDINDNLGFETAIAIGNFDGIHNGHKKVITELISRAKSKNIQSAIFCFEPQPQEFFNKIKTNFRITNLKEKQRILENLGLENLIIANFDSDFSNINYRFFIEEIVLKKLNAKIIFTGEDFLFGKNREGNSKKIEEIKLEKNNFEYFKIPLLNNNSKKYSSSEIRNLINQGNIKLTNYLLGHNFFIIQKVINGLKNGAKIGFPTANVNIENYIQPKFGVYKTNAVIEGKKYNSISNFGIKPTIEGTNSPLLETHILNFNDDIYKKEILIEFIDFLREEKKFNSLEELKNQIAKDIYAVS